MLVYIRDRRQYVGLHTWTPANGMTTSQFIRAALPNSQAWMLAGQFCNVTLWPGPRSRGRETVSSATLHLQNSRHLRRIVYCRAALQLFSSLGYSSILSAILTGHRPKTLRISTRSSHLLAACTVTGNAVHRRQATQPGLGMRVSKRPDVWPHEPLSYSTQMMGFELGVIYI